MTSVRIAWFCWVVAGCSSSSSAGDDAAALAAIQSQAATAFGQPGTVDATIAANYPGLQTWTLSWSDAGSSFVVVGADANKVPHVRLALTADGQRDVSGTVFEQAADGGGAPADVVSALETDIDRQAGEVPSTFASTVQALAPGQLRITGRTPAPLVVGGGKLVKGCFTNLVGDYEGTKLLVSLWRDSVQGGKDARDPLAPLPDPESGINTRQDVRDMVQAYCTDQGEPLTVPAPTPASNSLVK